MRPLVLHTRVRESSHDVGCLPLALSPGIADGTSILNDPRAGRGGKCALKRCCPLGLRVSQVLLASPWQTGSCVHVRMCAWRPHCVVQWPPLLWGLWCTVGRAYEEGASFGDLRLIGMPSTATGLKTMFGLGGSPPRMVAHIGGNGPWAETPSAEHPRAGRPLTDGFPVSRYTCNVESFVLPHFRWQITEGRCSALKDVLETENSR